MPVVMLLAVLGILVGVFFVATGRGGELAYEQVDHPPIDLGPVSPTDVAMLRPPTTLWGYNMQVTDEALDRIARALRDRDIEIAYLQRRLADAGHPEPQPARGFASGYEPPPPVMPQDEPPGPNEAADHDLDDRAEAAAEAEAEEQGW